MRRRQDKIDRNQKAIIEALRALPNVSVEPGHDDIIVGLRGQTFWYEIKDTSQLSKKTGKLRESAKTEDQKRLDRTWKGHRKYVTSIDEILEDIFR